MSKEGNFFIIISYDLSAKDIFIIVKRENYFSGELGRKQKRKFFRYRDHFSLPVADVMVAPVSFSSRDRCCDKAKSLV